MSQDGDYSYESGGDADGPVVPGFDQLALIGEGGFSVVYSARQPALNRRVAIKVLNIAGSNRRRFENECKTLGPLTGVKGVVPILQTAYTADGRPCIVMQLMEGGSLAHRLSRTGPLPASEVLAMGVTLCAALGDAHQRGISHRDVKPENVLLAADGSVAIADFGIALVEDLVAASMVSSSLSPAHAPPERFLEVDAANRSASDVYSLGSTLYQALTGRPPFGTHAEGGIAALMNRIIGAEVPPMGRPDVPPGLEAALRRSMAKDPDGRFASMAEFATVLRSVSVAPNGGGPGGFAPSSFLPPTARHSEVPPSYDASTMLVAGSSPPVPAASTLGPVTPPPAPPAAASALPDDRELAGGATVFVPPRYVEEAEPEPEPQRGGTKRWMLPLAGVAVATFVGAAVIAAMATGGGEPPSTTAAEATAVASAEPPVFVNPPQVNLETGRVVFSVENPNGSADLSRTVVWWELTVKGSDEVLLTSPVTEFPDPFDEGRPQIVVEGASGPRDVDVAVPAETAPPYCVTLSLHPPLLTEGPLLTWSGTECTDGTGG